MARHVPPRAAHSRARTARAAGALWAVLLSGLAGLLLGVGSSDYCLIDEVRVYCADESLRQEAAEQADALSYGNIWFPPTHDIERSIGGLARAAGVRIRRDPPSALVIHVQPRTPVAVMEIGDRLMMLDADGVCLNWTGRAAADMSILRIADPWALSVGDIMGERDVELFREVREGLRQVGIEGGTRVDISTIHRIEVFTADGVLGKLGDPHLLSQKVVLFGKLIDSLRSSHEEPLYIDLRVPSRPTYRPVN